MRILLALQLLFFLLEASGQSILKTFYTKSHNEIDSANSFYYEIVINESDGGLPVKNSYYTANSKLREKWSRDNGQGIQEVEFYYPNGTLKAHGSFYRQRPSGLFHSYYPNGKQQGEFAYEKGSTSIEPSSMGIINYWDSTGVEIVTNGNGYCGCDLDPFDHSPAIETGKVTSGQKHGDWQGKTEVDNKPYSYSESYLEGTLIGGTLEYDGKTYAYEEIQKMAEPTGGIKDFYGFISNEIVYPRNARRNNIQGKIFVSFVVEKDGSLTHVKVIKGIGGECDEEAVRVVKVSPLWQPGLQRGRPVKQRMTVPIIFKLK